jgi:hypothetical protein
MSYFENPLLSSSATSVSSTKITITIPAKANMKCYIVAMSWTTDLDGLWTLQGGAGGTTIRFSGNSRIIGPNQFVLPIPWALSDTGVACTAAVDVTTTGRLSVLYFYAP